MTPAGDADHVTDQLNRLRNGESEAEAALRPVVQEELRRIARRYLRKDRRNHTLETNALVNEALARILGGRPVEFANRSHFYALAANNIRWVLVDYARKRIRRMDGQAQRVTLDDKLAVGSRDSWVQILALNGALTRFAEIYPRKAKVVEMRFFADMAEAEIAEVLKVNAKTVHRDWEFARSWLYAELVSSPGPTVE
jgi:RNA polymerase sigma factor (TIGR02999 family)